MKTQTRPSEALFTLTGTPPLGALFSLALQHLVAMIVGCVTPSIIVANAAGMSAADKVVLIQAALVVSALSTLLQVFAIGGKGFRFGSGLPVIMGISFAYVSTMQGIVDQDPAHGVARIAGAMVVGGVVAFLIGLFIKPIRKLFPPLVTGTVVFTVGLSLYRTAVNYMAGGTANTYALVVETQGKTEALVYGSWQNWLVAFITLAVVILLNHYAKGILKLASILVGMAAGYAVAACFGMVSFTDVADAGWVAAPQVLPFGIEFEAGACLSIGILFAINSIQAIGDFTATTTGGLDREPTDQELQGGIVCYGVTNAVASLFGGLPTATYSQNVGIVATTKVVNRKIFGLTAVLLLLAGLIPKFSALLTTIPQCVLCGATITVFASIAMTGIKLLITDGGGITARGWAIVGLSVALGVGISQAPEALANLPATLSLAFGSSPMVVTTIMAILLNQILPKDKSADT